MSRSDKNYNTFFNFKFLKRMESHLVTKTHFIPVSKLLTDQNFCHKYEIITWVQMSWNACDKNKQTSWG